MDFVLYITFMYAELRSYIKLIANIQSLLWFGFCIISRCPWPKLLIDYMVHEFRTRITKIRVHIGLSDEKTIVLASMINIPITNYGKKP